MNERRRRALTVIAFAGGIGAVAMAVYIAFHPMDFLPFDPAGRHPTDIPLALEAKSDGSVLTRLSPCAGEVISTISAETGTTHVVWKVTAPGASPTSFTVGQAPPSFTTSVPLDAPLPSKGSYTLIVTGRSADGRAIATVEVVTPRFLQENLVWVEPNNYISLDEFERRARERCGQTPQRPRPSITKTPGSR